MTAQSAIQYSTVLYWWYSQPLTRCMHRQLKSEVTDSDSDSADDVKAMIPRILSARKYYIDGIVSKPSAPTASGSSSATASASSSSHVARAPYR